MSENEMKELKRLLEKAKASEQLIIISRKNDEIEEIEIEEIELAEHRFSRTSTLEIYI